MIKYSINNGFVQSDLKIRLAFFMSDHWEKKISKLMASGLPEVKRISNDNITNINSRKLLYV